MYFNSTPPFTNLNLESAMNKETIKGNIEKNRIIITEGKIKTNGACLSKRSPNEVFIVMRLMDRPLLYKDRSLDCFNNQVFFDTHLTEYHVPFLP
jgi:hypothetical protein